jgi:hypothetical protein
MAGLSESFGNILTNRFSSVGISEDPSLYSLKSEAVALVEFIAKS